MPEPDAEAPILARHPKLAYRQVAFRWCFDEESHCGAKGEEEAAVFLNRELERNPILDRK